MPVENIFNDGSIMYNVRLDGMEGLSECYYSFYGEIHADDDLPADIVASAKAGNEKYWRYLTPAQAKIRKNHQQELENLAAGIDMTIPEEEPAEGSVKV